MEGIPGHSTFERFVEACGDGTALDDRGRSYGTQKLYEANVMSIDFPSGTDVPRSCM